MILPDSDSLLYAVVRAPHPAENVILISPMVVIVNGTEWCSRQANIMTHGQSQEVPFLHHYPLTLERGLVHPIPLAVTLVSTSPHHHHQTIGPSFAQKTARLLACRLR